MELLIQQFHATFLLYQNQEGDLCSTTLLLYKNIDNQI